MYYLLFTDKVEKIHDDKASLNHDVSLKISIKIISENKQSISIHNKYWKYREIMQKTLKAESSLLKHCFWNVKIYTILCLKWLSEQELCELQYYG